MVIKKTVLAFALIITAWSVTGIQDATSEKRASKGSRVERTTSSKVKRPAVKRRQPRRPTRGKGTTRDTARPGDPSAEPKGEDAVTNTSSSVSSPITAAPESPIDLVNSPFDDGMDARQSGGSSALGEESKSSSGEGSSSSGESGVGGKGGSLPVSANEDMAEPAHTDGSDSSDTPTAVADSEETADPELTETPEGTPTTGGTDSPTPVVTNEPEVTFGPRATEFPFESPDVSNTYTPVPDTTYIPYTPSVPVNTEAPETDSTPVPEESPRAEATSDPEFTDIPEATHSPDSTKVPQESPTVSITDSPQSDETSAPDVTEAPEATESPEETEAPEESPTVSATDLPESDETSAPDVTEAPEGTESPEETEAPEESPTVSVTDLPESDETSTPDPTEAPEGTESPEETEAPEESPTVSVTDSPTPEVTNEPEPTTTPEKTHTPESSPTPYVTTSPEVTERPERTAVPDNSPTVVVTEPPLPEQTKVPDTFVDPEVTTTPEESPTVSTTETPLSDETETPEPTQSPEVSETSTPEPTETPAETETPMGSETPEETPTLDPEAPEQCLDDEAFNEEVQDITEAAGLTAPSEMKCPEALPADGSDAPDLGPQSVLRQEIIEEDGTHSYTAEGVVPAESVCSAEATEEETAAAPDDEPPPLTPKAPERRKPCCFFTYSDEGSGGGTYHRGDGHDAHASAFKWPADCQGRIVNCALDATKNPFGVRFCRLYNGKELVKRFNSMKEAAEDLQCGMQRHLTLYHANPEWGMRMCNAVRQACELEGVPTNVQHINMGCSTFGNPKSICGAASEMASKFKSRCNKFTGTPESAVLTGNYVDNWFPASLGSCSWKNPDGYASGSNYNTIRKLIATKAGFIACRKRNGVWEDDTRFCAGTKGYLAPGSADRPASLKCDNTAQVK